MSNEQALPKTRVIAELTRSPHGDLAQYVPTSTQAVGEDPVFFSHLIAWNHARGSIRDAKVALPVVALTAQAVSEDAELSGNALAALASLSPRELVKAVRFSRSLPVVRRARLKPFVTRYLVNMQASRAGFERRVAQHRGALHELHALMHIKPETAARELLFEGKATGVLASLRNLKTMSANEIAGTIERDRLPFLAVTGALGVRVKEPDVLRAVIGTMTPTELVTNAKALDRLGVKDDPALRAAVEAGMQKVSTSKAAVLKTTRAAEAVGGKMGEQLKGAQERQLQQMTVEGDWLIVCDRSDSMRNSIETARHVAAFLARMAAGSVNLVFFNTTPERFEVTGKSLEQITELTKRVTACGGTSPGCALGYALENNLPADGVVYVGDMNENRVPPFASKWQALEKKHDKALPLYCCYLKGDPPVLLKTLPRDGIDAQVFDLTGGVDYYSLPNLLQTMRTNRYSLVDEIMNTPFLRLGDVLKHAA